ncbi:hypothetical protein JXA32_11615 [Candidatus Sumerlaeota bacterium]|nr:hypothetical protein [Candidatus Sumerlaeota bacterium]
MATVNNPEGCVRVVCEMRDCIFFNEYPQSNTIVLCDHPEKKHHMGQMPCPLYRMDWNKKADMFDY